MVTDSLIIAGVAVVGVFLAWKVLKGIVKTVALIAVAAAAAFFLYGGQLS